MALAGRDRRYPHERTAAAAHQLARDVLEHVHGAVDVEVDRTSARFGVDLGDRPDGLRAARAMHPTVQPAVPRRRGVHRTHGLFLVGDIGWLITDLAPVTFERVDLFDGRGEAVRIAADDHDR